MRNKLYKAFTILLLALTLISNGSFNLYTDYTSEPEISVYGIDPEDEPFDNGENKPVSP